MLFGQRSWPRLYGRIAAVASASAGVQHTNQHAPRICAVAFGHFVAAHVNGNAADVVQISVEKEASFAASAHRSS
jgi:hypothetical protein